MNNSKFSEKLLLLRLKKKDPEAFAQAYDLYITPIYRFIYFKVSNHHDAEDLTSEVFLKTWHYVTETENQIENLRALLYKTARNSVIDFYRRRVGREIIGDEDMMLKVEDTRQQKLLEKIEIASDVTNIESVLRKVKDEYREVVMMHFIDELSISEIAKILDKSKGAIRVLLHRAIKVIQELLK